MSGRAAKQSYLGRVISPARYHEGQNGSRPYLSFQVFVDRLAVKAENKRERVSGKIFCSYSVQSEDDPVAFILCNILDSKTGAGGINGHTYKSVEVWVEGNEKLTEVKAFDDKGQELNGAYYKSLEFCAVQILDRGLIKLLKGTSTSDNDENQPNLAPSSGSKFNSRQTSQPSTQAEQKNRKSYNVGDRLTHNGQTFEFTGGDPSSASNWRTVEETATAAPFAKQAAATTQAAPSTSNPFKPSAVVAPTNSIRTMLEEDEGSDGPEFGDRANRPPV